MHKQLRDSLLLQLAFTLVIFDEIHKAKNGPIDAESKDDATKAAADDEALLGANPARKQKGKAAQNEPTAKWRLLKYLCNTRRQAVLGLTGNADPDSDPGPDPGPDPNPNANANPNPNPNPNPKAHLWPIACKTSLTSPWACTCRIGNPNPNPNPNANPNPNPNQVPPHAVLENSLSRGAQAFHVGIHPSKNWQAGACVP